jgi:peptidoglycan/xylan/chitin deacetylase (PgdA/CDA1 family)
LVKIIYSRKKLQVALNICNKYENISYFLQVNLGLPVIRKYLHFLLLFISVPSFAQNICLSYDDAPRKDGFKFNGIERTTILSGEFNQAGISPIIFCVPKNIDSTGIQRLRDYVKAGCTIGNHSYSHNHISDIGTANYINDVLKADTVLSQLQGYEKIFRYPYLEEGNTQQTRDSIRNVLIEHGFEFGYVTVDTYDWYLNFVIAEAVRNGKKINYEALKEVYIELIWQSLQFYDNIAKSVLGRSPNHVILLHENDLAALYAKDLINYLKSQGCNFITPQEAYSDRIARQGMSTLFNGQGKISAIAKEMGYNGTFWPITEEEEYIDKLVIEKKVIE